MHQGVGSNSKHANQEEHEDGQHQHPLIGVGESEGDVEGPEGQEGEELDVVAHQQLQPAPSPERVWPDVLAHLEVEQEIEEPIREEQKHGHEQHKECEEGNRVDHQGIVLPLHLHVPHIRVDVILTPLHCFFQLRPVLVQLDDLPLLVLHEADGGEDNLQDALVLRLVVLVQPQVIHQQEQGLEHPSPDQVQERPGLAHDIQHFTLHHTLPSCIYGVELGTGGTVILHIPACLTFLAAVLRAHIL